MEKSSTVIIIIWVGLGFSWFFIFLGGCYTVTRSTMAGPMTPWPHGPQPARSRTSLRPPKWRIRATTVAKPRPLAMCRADCLESGNIFTGNPWAFDMFWPIGGNIWTGNPWLIWLIDHPNWMASPQTFPPNPMKLHLRAVLMDGFSPSTQSCDCCLLWRIKVIQIEYRGTWCHQPHFQKQKGIKPVQKPLNANQKKTEKKTENMKMILFKAPEIIKKQVEQCFLMVNPVTRL